MLQDTNSTSILKATRAPEKQHQLAKPRAKERGPASADGNRSLLTLKRAVQSPSRTETEKCHLFAWWHHSSVKSMRRGRDRVPAWQGPPDESRADTLCVLQRALGFPSTLHLLGSQFQMHPRHLRCSTTCVPPQAVGREELEQRMVA